MSLKIAAEHLKSKGRGPDTELVHMTKGEIKGLRQLALAHGGDLTINPETGLPEAGFLSKILPIVAAGAATYFTAGAAAPLLEAELAGGALAGYGGLMAGAGAGALIGGVSAGIQGGNVGRGALFGGLGGALSGGLGAYDASPALNPTTGEEITKLTLNSDVNAGLAGTTQYVPTPPPAAPFTPAELAAGTSRAASTIPEVTAAQSAEAMKTLGNAGVSYGTQAVPGSMGATYGELGSSMTDMAKKAAILGAPGFGAQMGAGDAFAGSSGQVPTGQQTPSMLSRISPNFRAQEPAQPNPYYVAQYEDYRVPRAATGGLMNSAFGPQDGQTNYAGGGAIAFANRGVVQDLPRDPGMSSGTYTDTDPNTASLDAYNAALYRFNKVNKKAGIKAPVQFKQAQALGDIEEAAGGGIMHGLGGYSDGGRMLKGPGDGMSDSIPATIGSKQPARLADGEFVVPADVVSHLGNGSTDAGAKRLYGMMDNIRKARTGKKKQAPEVNTRKFLPA